MTKNKDPISDFNDVTSSLKEYLDTIEELKNKDKTSAMAFVIQQKEIFKANKTNIKILEKSIKDLKIKLREIEKEIVVTNKIKSIIKDFSKEQLQEFKSSLKEMLSDDEIEDIFNFDKFLSNANKMKNEMKNLISQMQECLNQTNKIVDK